MRIIKDKNKKNGVKIVFHPVFLVLSGQGLQRKSAVDYILKIFVRNLNISRRIKANLSLYGKESAIANILKSRKIRLEVNSACA